MLRRLRRFAGDDERSAPGVSVSSTFAAHSRGGVTLALKRTPSGARV